MSVDSELQYYIRAGKIAREALQFASELVNMKKHISIYELCEKVEKFIIDSGGKPAFPCNISINNVAAHYTSISPDDGNLPDHGIVKIDVGVHIDGYIADTAISIPLSKEYSDIVEVNKEILDCIIEKFRPGVKLGEIGSLVSKMAKQHGYKTISNLTGHLISRYSLHAGKHVPNVPQIISPRIEIGEIYAIEPFLTFQNGSGRVIDLPDIRIYSLIRIKKIKDENVEKIRKYIHENFDKLPFAPRWLYNKFGQNIIEKLEYMRQKGVLRGYPVLVEERGAYVSQFEHTVVVLKDETIVVT